MSLIERLTRLSNEIYKRTKANPANWVHHSHGPDDRAATCGVCQIFGLTQEDWDAMINKLTGKRHGPLVALADVMVTSKEIKRWLKPKVEASVALSLKCKDTFAKAKVAARRAAEKELNDRFFSQFGKKRMLDKIVSRAMHGYRLKLRARILEDLREAKADRDYYSESEVKRLRAKLATGLY